MVSDAKKRAVARYNQKNYKSVAIRWPKEFVEALNEASASSRDKSLASYIRSAIEDRMRRDGFELRVPQDESNESEEQQETETEER